MNNENKTFIHGTSWFKIKLRTKILLTSLKSFCDCIVNQSILCNNNFKDIGISKMYSLRNDLNCSMI